jgi:hypothetical protein
VSSFATAITRITKQFLDINNNKIIPTATDIFNLLNPVTLAFWIMGDGEARISGLVICTDSYSISDVVRLLNVLMTKFNLNCRIH